MMTNRLATPDSGSFRDPSGVVFWRDGELLRQINPCYREQYNCLMSSGLYKSLTDQGLLIDHQETDTLGLTGEAFLVVKPRMVPMVSYPYEWCFGQMKDAALATLRIHHAAMEHGMILKDASAYNIQFVRGQALLIDTLSFDFYKEGEPWVAYGQLCRHFLAPLFLMAYTDIRLSQLMRVYIDGIPLDLASKLLKGKGGFAVKQHIHWHAKSVIRHGQAGQEKKASSGGIKISRFQAVAMIESLIRIVEKLSLKGVVTEWGDYYTHTNYSGSAFQSKKTLVSGYLERVSPAITWDLGANDGTFSRLALSGERFVAAFDIDPVAVDCNHSAVRGSRENLLPLLLDLTNPSPSIGFANAERGTLFQRRAPDCILLLAVIHHMAISNNLPLWKIMQWLASLCGHLIIEFVPKQDSQVQVLLATRDDIFPDYTAEGLEKAAEDYFEILDKQPVDGSERLMYLMKSKIKQK